MNVHTKRRKRHRVNAVLKYGKSAVRKHMRKSGRTGGIWSKRTHGKHNASGTETEGQDATAEQRLGAEHEGPTAQPGRPEAVAQPQRNRGEES